MPGMRQVKKSSNGCCGTVGAFTHGAKRGGDDMRGSTQVSHLTLRYRDHGIFFDSPSNLYCTVPFTTTTTNPENSFSQNLFSIVQWLSYERLC
jgi:hypothetical protein